MYFHALTKILRLLALLSISTQTLAINVDDQLPTGHGLNALLQQIYGIVTVGHWQHKGKQGNYRIIALRANKKTSRAKLYIQWISNPTTDLNYHVYATVSVEEIDVLAIDRFMTPEFYIDNNNRNILVFKPSDLDAPDSHVMTMELFQHPGYSIISGLESNSAKIDHTQSNTDQKSLKALKKIPLNILNYRWPSF